MILLDTCTLLWLAAGRLPDPVAARIAEADAAYVSAISALEIGIQVAKGKLELPLPPPRWWSAALAHHGLAEVPVDAAIALRAAALPPLHADPADRVILATAVWLGAALLTPDPLIRAYPGATTVWD